MEARTVGVSISVALLAMFGGFVMHSMRYDSLETTQQKVRDQLAAARSELETMEARTARTTKRLDELKAAAKADAGMAERIGSLEGTLKTKTASLEKTNKELEAVEKEIDRAIEAQRAAAVGTTYPQIPLTNGRSLLSAKLVRFSPSSVDFIHGAGKATVRWNELPKEMIERLGMGESEGEEEEEVVEKKEAESPETEEVAESDEAAKRAKQKEQLRVRLTAVRRELAAAKASLEVMQRKSAPNREELRALQRKAAALFVTEQDLAERVLAPD
jgi:hypothetical protein